jgi:polyhydroxyalkanoate synthesis regulator phasin
VSLQAIYLPSGSELASDCEQGRALVTMMDVIKRTLLAGVGAAVITKEKVESALGEFVAKGKVSSAEARQMAEKIAEEGRREFETLSQELNEKLRERFSGAERRAQERIDALEARVAALESEAGSSRVPTSGPTPRSPGV